MFKIIHKRKNVMAAGFFVCLLMSIFSTASFAGSQSSLKFEVVPAPESEFKTNAVVVYGKKNAILFDATFTLSAADKLVKRIKKLDRKLTAIYLTHGHPDHAFGLNRILESFPGVKIYASPGVSHELERDFYSKLVRWQVDFPNDLPSSLPSFQKLEGKILLEGHEIQWVNTVAGESWDATVYFVPKTKTLITGDLLFNKMHMYQQDVFRPKMWIGILDSLNATFGEITTVIPGHGEVGSADIIKENRDYLVEYMSVATLPFPDLIKVHDHMVKKYPDWIWPQILHMTRGPAITDPEIMKLYAPKH